MWSVGSEALDFRWILFWVLSFVVFFFWNLGRPKCEKLEFLFWFVDFQAQKFLKLPIQIPFCLNLLRDFCGKFYLYICLLYVQSIILWPFGVIDIVKRVCLMFEIKQKQQFSGLEFSCVLATWIEIALKSVFNIFFNRLLSRCRLLFVAQRCNSFDFHFSHTRGKKCLKEEKQTECSSKSSVGWFKKCLLKFSRVKTTGVENYFQKVCCTGRHTAMTLVQWADACRSYSHFSSFQTE